MKKKEALIAVIQCISDVLEALNIAVNLQRLPDTHEPGDTTQIAAAR